MIEAFAAGVHSPLCEVSGKTSGKDTSPTHLFDDTQVQQAAEAIFRTIGDHLSTANVVQHQEVTSAERLELVTPYSLQEANERRVANFAVESHAHLISIRSGEVRDLFALPDGLLEHPVHALA